MGSKVQGLVTQMDGGNNPDAEHPADLIHDAFKCDILFRINGFNVFHETNKDPDHIEFETTS